jgi:transposase-like protein
MDVAKKTRPVAPELSGAEIRAADQRARVQAATQAGARVKPAAVTRRVFTPEYQRRIIGQADDALASGEPGAVGALLRREGLYGSHLANWRKKRDAGELDAPPRRGRPVTRNPLADDVARLQREKAALEEKLRRAEIVIDVQKKVSLLLGIPVATPPDDEPTS